jgi:hypothetical protein
MTDPEPPSEPYTEAAPPYYLEHLSPEELAALGTQENPWPPPPEGWVVP